MIMGLWASIAFLRYIRIQVSDLSKGISTLMKNNHAFYTIPEIEVVYHTVSPTLCTQKNGVKNATVTQGQTTTTLYLVHIWAKIIIRLDSYLGTTRDTPVNTVWVERQKKTITSQMTTNSLRVGTLSFGEDRLGFSHKEVVTHSIWSGFSMELYLTKVCPETIMVMGRWSSNAYFWYIRIQISDLSKGISTLIINKQTFYTIPVTEFFYHTPGHDNKEPKRLNLNR